MNRSIRDLCLTIKPATPPAAGYLVTLHNLRVPDESRHAHVPKGDPIGGLIATRLRAMLSANTASPAPEALRTTGRVLANLLLPSGGIRDLLFAVLARDLAAVVRLRLEIAPPELADLPWELTYLDGPPYLREVEGFLGLHTHFRLVRQAAQAPPASPPADPLRVLVAWADPRSFDNPQLLDVTAEAYSVRNVLEARKQNGRIQVVELRQATPERLQAEIQTWHPHVFHFIGHGGEKQDGGLVLESNQPRAEAFLPGAELARWLAGTDVRLVVLSACRTAGVARALIASGVDAVLAMQLPWRDAIAALFFRSFYGVLMESRGIEEALHAGREALRYSGSDWAVPSLSLSRDTDRLFPPPPATAQPAKPAYSKLRYFQNEDFCGRERDLDELHQSFSVRHRIALVGLGGLGKTQLASEYGHRFRQEYPGGVYWIDARDTLRIKEDYARISLYFDVPATLSSEARAERMIQILQDLPNPALVICDNITKDTDLGLLPTVGNCRILATAREEYTVRGAFQIRTLATLAPEAACRLLQTDQQAQGANEQAAVKKIAALLGNLPLALVLVANNLRQYSGNSHPFTNYLKLLQAGPREALEELARTSLPSITGHDGAIFDAMEISYRGLSKEAQAILTTASCFAARSIPPDLLLSACAGYGSKEVARARAELTACSLLTIEEDERLSMHELVRLFARSRVSEKTFRETLGRVAGELAAHLAAANKAMDWRVVSAHIAHCRSVIELFSGQPAADCYIDLLRELGFYYYEQGEIAEGSRHLEVGLQIAEQHYGARHAAVAGLLFHLGKVRQAQGETARDQGNQAQSHEHFAEACRYQETALEIAQEVYGSNDAQTFDYYNELGVILRRQGKMEAAQRCYEQALKISTQAYGPCHEKVAMCRNNFGGMYEAQNRLDEALNYLRRSRSILQRLFGVREPGGHYRVVHARYAIRMNSIGRILRKQGKARIALARHRAALNIFLQLYRDAPHGHLDLAYTYYYLAETESMLDHSIEARYYYEVAQPMFVYFLDATHEICREVARKIQILTDSAAIEPE